MEKINTKSFTLGVYAKGSRDATRLALVLPGRLDTKDYAHMRSHVEYLASKGYFALSFDPPGTWESPGGIELYTTTNYLKAINELIELFGNKPTLLMGHSRGGSIAMLAGAKNPHITHFVAVMSHAAPSVPSEEDEKRGVHLSFRDLPPGTEPTKEKKRFDLPYRYFEDTMQYNIADALKACTKPKLFFLGLRDTMAEPNDVKEAYGF